MNIKMERQFWRNIFILWICARCTFALNETNPSDIAVILRDVDDRKITTEQTAVATTEEYYRQSKWARHDREGYAVVEPRTTHNDYQEEDFDHLDDANNLKAATKGKADYWGGYYDFLINEGSYKFWAVFQVATAALLIYSGFAALYYAKVNPQTTEDYDDYLLRRRRRFVDEPPRDLPFFGFQPELLQRIFDAITKTDER